MRRNVTILGLARVGAIAVSLGAALSAAAQQTSTAPNEPPPNEEAIERRTPRKTGCVSLGSGVKHGEERGQKREI